MSQIKRKKIPQSWIQAPLSELFLDPKNNIVDGPFGSNLKASEYQDEGIPVIRIQNIDRNRFIDKNINYVSEEKADFLSRHSFKSGDIIITKLGDPVGKACFVPKKYKKGIIVADLIRARIDHQHVSDKFLLYQLNSGNLIKQFDKFTKGTTRPRVKLSIVRELILNLPPLNEQHRIVSKIEELFSELDNGLANLKLAQNQLKVYRQALLKYAFEGKLTELWRKENSPTPAEKLLERIKEERQNHYEQELKDWKAAVKVWEKDGKNGSKPRKPSILKGFPLITKKDISDFSEIPSCWIWTRIGEVVYKVGDIDHKMPKDFPNGIPYLSTGNIKSDGTLDFLNVKTISEEDYLALSGKIKPNKRDIIFPRYGTIGRNVLVNTDRKFLISYSCAIIKTIHRFLNEKFLYLYTLSPLIKSEIEKYTVQTTQANIGITSIEKFIIPLCSEGEQKVIVDELEKQFSQIDNLEQTIKSSLQKSEALRQSILKKAFEGKLVPQNFKDEPASELLKRIQAERKKYLEEQKQQKKRKPNYTKKMSKELSIEEVLKTSDKPMLAKDVWQKSRHKANIEDFYKELKDVQSKIKEVKKGTESLLSLVK